MNFIIKPASKLQKDLKGIIKSSFDLNEITQVINILASCKKLPDKYKDHRLIGSYKAKSECHIRPDWLLIYEISQKDKTLYLIRTKSHSDLFD